MSRIQSTNNNQSFTAIHIGDGNFFDDVRIDIDKSHKSIEGLSRRQQESSNSYLGNMSKYYVNRFLMKYRLQEFLVNNGFKRKWFNDFHDYWTRIINGRPLTVMDFFMLLYDYRKRQQYTEALNWDTPEVHVNNWQNPNQIYSILHNVRRTALNPIVGHHLWRKVKKNSQILEYGCSLAPYYHCYRHFFSHLCCKWLLVDIPNFPFHYAKYLYRNDASVSFSTIYPRDFKSPLKDYGNFDVIIITTVLEHLDDPIFVSNYILDRLELGGLFVFDYIISKGTGLDTPIALEKRTDCLNGIMRRIKIVHGKVDIFQNVGLCIGEKIA